MNTLLNIIGKALAKFAVQTMLISDRTITIDVGDRIYYMISILSKTAIIAFIIEHIKWWMDDNALFGKSVLAMMIINLLTGAYTHWKNGTFSWGECLRKNANMLIVIILVYFALDILRYNVGDNLLAEIYKTTIQIATLMYPAGKILKNGFILSDGKMPPEFIIKKIYNWEKSGDLKSFFDNKKEEEIND